MRRTLSTLAVCLSAFTVMATANHYLLGSVRAGSSHYSRVARPVMASTAPAQRRELSLPSAREETAAATLHGQLYVMGGLDVSGQDSTTVFVFDGHKWSTGPPIPIALDHASAAVFAGRLYLAGGFTYGRASDEIFVLSPSRRAWVRDGHLIDARGAFALVASGGTLYAIGGKDGNGLEISRGEEYRPQEARWSHISALPWPRDHVAGFSYHGWACAAGGRSPNYSRVDCYVPRIHSWQRLPDLPVATSGAGAGVSATGVVVGGGELAAEGGGIVSRLDRLRRGKWMSDHMLIPRHGIQFAPFQGRLWACGGGIAPGLHPASTCTSIR